MRAISENEIIQSYIANMEVFNRDVVTSPENEGSGMALHGASPGMIVLVSVDPGNDIPGEYVEPAI